MPSSCRRGSRRPSKRQSPAVEAAAAHCQSGLRLPLRNRLSPVFAAAFARGRPPSQLLSPTVPAAVHLPLPAFATAVPHRHSCHRQLLLVAVFRPPRSLCRRLPAHISLPPPPMASSPLTSSLFPPPPPHAPVSRRAVHRPLLLPLLDVISIAGAGATFIVIAPVLPLKGHRRRADSG